MDMAQITILVGFAVSLGTAIGRVVDWFIGRRLGIGGVTDRLVDTLQSTVQAQAQQIATQAAHIAQLSADLARERTERTALAVEVASLKDTVSAQAVELASRRPRTRRVTPE
jgi:hypothetical protein